MGKNIKKSNEAKLKLYLQKLKNDIKPGNTKAGGARPKP